MAGMRITKLHGLGNDFVLLDWRQAGVDAPSIELARKLCDRHRGVGADGVLTLLPHADGTRLVIHNPDGSRPEMCGNGARCAALWLATDGLQKATGAEVRVRLQTDAGVRDCTVAEGARLIGDVEIAMGVPEIAPHRTFVVEGAMREATPVSMGNPHRVFFVEDAPGPLLSLAARAGPQLCLAEDANIEFARRTAPQQLEVAVWERGAGLTQACGTGACAVAAAAMARGVVEKSKPVAVDLPGGRLVLRLEPASGQLLMRGPAQFVFSGEWG
ncbi:MAG: diaminopimelate epimerase [Deltaproteobacteria bacterium]|nr:diaminopimelate epimerase [Deltaproteobacteria bacterium]